VKTASTRYVAYGLALECSFELAGMTPSRGTGLPSLKLEMLSPQALARAYSGSDDPPIWRGQLGDGGELTIESGRADDLLIVDGDRADFLLHPSRESLACAPRRPGLGWQRTLLSKVLSVVSIRRGYEALHASAVDSPHGAVAIAAPPGTGKTTLALELMRDGWPLLADDVLALSVTPSGPVAHPGTPHMNLAVGAGDDRDADDRGVTLATIGDERWIAAHAVTGEPRPLHAVCLLRRAAGLSLDARVLPANPLTLAPFMLGLLGDARRGRSRFELYADIAASVALIGLTCDLAAGPAQLAERLRRTLAARSGALAVGAVR
jgi:hypothetical protein